MLGEHYTFIVECNCVAVMQLHYSGNPMYASGNYSGKCMGPNSKISGPPAIFFSFLADDYYYYQAISIWVWAAREDEFLIISFTSSYSLSCDKHFVESRLPWKTKLAQPGGPGPRIEGDPPIGLEIMCFCRCRAWRTHARARHHIRRWR